MVYKAVPYIIFISLLLNSSHSSLGNCAGNDSKPRDSEIDHPAFKMLALSFLLLIGVSLIAEGLEFHIPKGYIYFSMAFSMLVTFFQTKTHKPKDKPVQTHEHYIQDEKGNDKV